MNDNNTRDKSGEPSESRCLCGQLLAKRVKDGIEVKCRRCRRVVRIPWSEIEK